MRAEAAATATAATRARLEFVANAHQDQVRRLGALLAPLGLEHSQADQATLEGIGTRLPTEQGLTNYYVNLHRDWAWGDEENAAGLAEILGCARRQGARPRSHPGARRRGGSAGL